jgi:hypothetical protein
MKLLLVVLLIGLILTAAPAVQAADNALCTVSGRLTLKPGLTFTSGTSTFASHGPTGTIDCHGSVKGHRVTGSGTLANSGLIVGSCSQSTGSGRFVARIPTSEGTRRVSGSYTFRALGAVGTFSGPPFSGAFEFRAEAGDCVNAPLTQVTVLGQGVLTT